MRELLLLITSTAALAGCPPPRSAVRCEDSKNVRCITAPVCEYDAARGCETCRCAPPPYAPAQQSPPK